MDDIEDKYSNLSGKEDEGEPVDYDPFPEDQIALAMKSIEKLSRVCTSNMDKMSAALNKQAQALKALADAITSPRAIVRDHQGKITGTKIVH
jgi:hypothetical protein